ncbi:MAG: hypothetical protein LBS19_14090 [Clostridiales bacterium]|jgi:hypothetical protein|nr:hypothetical protein [Clostridiales bacterium]
MSLISAGKSRKGDVIDNMGITNGQFKSYIRLLIAHVREAKDEKDNDIRTQKLEEILAILQTALED